MKPGRLVPEQTGHLACCIRLYQVCSGFAIPQALLRDSATALAGSAAGQFLLVFIVWYQLSGTVCKLLNFSAKDQWLHLALKCQELDWLAGSPWGVHELYTREHARMT